ncbi:MAG: MptD family putative ECF transporter S component [Tissierellia bacterium]|nr:MptD family putative ECF transporter S component [Tissierellia bacterium]
MKNNDKLKGRDFVTIGIFTVLYFALLWIVGMIGMVPVLYALFPFAAGIVAGPLMMLFYAKEAKPWTLLIMGLLLPIAFFLMGHHFLIIILALPFFIIAELIRRSGKCISFAKNKLSYAVFNMFLCVSIMQAKLVPEFYENLTVNMMGREYHDSLVKIFSWPVIIGMFITAFIGGLIGAYLGKKMLKKHFEKAGIV